MTATVLNEPPLDLLQRSLWDNLSHRQLHCVEQAGAIIRLLKLLPAATVCADWLPRFNLRPTQGTLRRMQQIAELPPDIMQLLSKDCITERTALLLTEADDGLAMALAPVLRAIQASASRQREIVQFCRDMTRRDQVTATDLLQRIDASKICNDAQLSPGKRAERVWQRLRAVRFPHLTMRETRFADLRQQLRLPKGMRLEHPPFFEGGGYRLTIALNETQVLPQQADEIARLLHDPTLDMILRDDD